MVSGPAGRERLANGFRRFGRGGVKAGQTRRRHKQHRRVLYGIPARCMWDIKIWHISNVVFGDEVVRLSLAVHQ